MKILCCGNRDRGDDGAGILVAERLNQLGIAAETCSGEASSLMQSCDRASDVLLVDAVVTGAPVGTVHHWDVSQFALAQPRSHSTHGFGLAMAVELARTLGRLPQQLQIYGIEAGRFEIGTPASGRVAQAAELVARQIAQAMGVTS